MRKMIADHHSLIPIDNTTVHKESQYPLWMYVLDAFMSLFVCCVAYLCMFFAGDIEWCIQELLLCIAFLFPVFFISALLLNGLYVTVNAKKMLVQFGFLFSPLKLDLPSIDSMEVRSFRPMRDFGGWGIKRNKDVKGYFMNGPLGLLITMRNGEQYMIGSDNPHHLVAIIDAMRGKS